MMSIVITFISSFIFYAIFCALPVASFVINANDRINHKSGYLNLVSRPNNIILYSQEKIIDEPDNEIEKEYRNVATQVLSNFLPKEKEENIAANGQDSIDPIAAINFSAPKISKKNLEELAAILDYELYDKEWFVTGNVNPIYFSDDFQFQDPDVKISGIEEYAKGVYKLFDQSSRAEIISTVVNTTVPDTITVTWRLSGKVNIGPGLTIKPYIVFTDFVVDPSSGLIISQEDRFDLPGWDILLSSFFPFLIGKVTAPPAPEVEARVVTMPSTKTVSNNFLSNFFDSLLPQNK